MDKLVFTEGGKQVLFQVSTHQPPSLNKMWKEYKKIKEKSALLQKPHNTLRKFNRSATKASFGNCQNLVCEMQFIGANFTLPMLSNIHGYPCEKLWHYDFMEDILKKRLLSDIFYVLI